MPEQPPRLRGQVLGDQRLNQLRHLDIVIAQVGDLQQERFTQIARANSGRMKRLNDLQNFQNSVAGNIRRVGKGFDDLLRCECWFGIGAGI